MVILRDVSEGRSVPRDANLGRAPPGGRSSGQGCRGPPAAASATTTNFACVVLRRPLRELPATAPRCATTPRGSGGARLGLVCEVGRQPALGLAHGHVLAGGVVLDL